MLEKAYGIEIQHDGGSNPAVDIVFVHGLGGDAIQTWTHQISKKFWPGDLLPMEMPDARTMTFGYDAKTASFRSLSRSSFTLNANNLVDRLVKKRQTDNEKKRKIIFVAHSLGGLLLLQAVQHINNSHCEDYERILESTVGFLFLGVPFFGSQLINLLKLLLDKSKLLFLNRIHKDKIEMLLPRSEQRQILVENFSSALRRRNDEMVLCVCEELETNGIEVNYLLGTIQLIWQTNIF